MPQNPRPLIRLKPVPQDVRHRNSSFPIPRPTFPSGARQVARLDGRFQALQAAFDRAAVRVQSDLAGAEPNQVLQFECIGSISNATSALQRIEGLHVAFEYSNRTAPDSDFFLADDPAHEIQNSFYLVIQDQRGLSQLLSLWSSYKQDPDNFTLPHGMGALRDVFGHLKDIRTWGPQDRLTRQFASTLQERIEAGDEKLLVEIELWFFSSSQKRSQSQERVISSVVRAGGRVFDTCLMEEISYHAVLAEVPIRELRDLHGSSDAALIRADNVMYFYPPGQALLGNLDESLAQARTRTFVNNDSTRPPIVALLDGLPQENHACLAGCLRVEDPQGLAATYPVQNRVHGTGMASLISRGDLVNDGSPLRTPLVVVPVMSPSAPGLDLRVREEFPRERLIVNVVREAVEHALRVSPSLRIFNCSLGDRNRPFDQGPSPWARLLDFLSWDKKILFIVSSGNVPDSIEVGFSRVDVERMAPWHLDLQMSALRKISDDWIDRRIISPAEGINVLTVGAIHEDNSSTTPPRHGVFLMGSNRMPACYSRQGPGVRGGVKPDILVSGGRQLRTIDFGFNQPRSQMLRIRETSTAPGFEVAIPAPIVAGASAYGFTRGTSISAALTSRAAARIYEAIEDGLIEGEFPTVEQMPAVLRALLVHRASWGPAGLAVGSLYSGIKAKSACRRMLGFGLVEYEELLHGEDPNSTSLIAVGFLEQEKADRYYFPLIDELRGRAWGRAVVTTLAWSTPTLSSALPYRATRLHCTLFGSQRPKVLANGRKIYHTVESESVEGALGLQAQEHAKKPTAGTLQHTVWKGDTSINFNAGSEHFIQVNCERVAGESLRGVRIPYALVVSMKVETDIRLDLHAKVRAAVQGRVSIRT